MWHEEKQRRGGGGRALMRGSFGERKETKLYEDVREGERGEEARRGGEVHFLIKRGIRLQGSR